MNAERVKSMRKMMVEQPNDPFLRYALALEVKSEYPKEACDHFDHLIENHPEYLPTYYQAAELFFEMDLLAKAKEAFEKGIALAKEQNELKTLQELNNAYQNFLFETEED
jgi:tetratricopeptide (TPR) repeat protein